MKVPATLLMLLASQIAAADFAARVAAGRVPPDSKALTDYYSTVMSNKVLPVMRSCAPPGADTSPTDWQLTLVGTISRTGSIEDIEVEPANAITTCVAEQLKKARPTTPAAGVIGAQGLPLLVEMAMKAAAMPQTSSIRTVTPVFSQLVGFMLPNGFVTAFETLGTTSYIREFVPRGENVEQWTQMISVTGGKDAALDAYASPAALAESAATRFQKACPGSFAATDGGALKIAGYDAFVAMMGCGSVRAASPRSEVAMVIAIKGKSDMYSIQWAERSTPVSRSAVLDGQKWESRFRQLAEIRVCERTEGEAAPFPSCIIEPGTQ